VKLRPNSDRTGIRLGIIRDDSDGWGETALGGLFGGRHINGQSDCATGDGGLEWTPWGKAKAINRYRAVAGRPAHVFPGLPYT